LKLCGSPLNSISLGFPETEVPVVTLCIAWQNSQGVHLAADSRISGGASPVDTGIKVFAIPVTVFPPRPAGGPDPEPIYRQVIGLSAAGSLLNVYNVAEVLRDVMQALYIVPWVDALSMDDLCRVVASFFQNVSRRVCNALASGAGGGSFFLAGYCQRDKRIRTFKLTLNITTSSITSVTAELDLAKGPECLGSGAAAALKLFAADPKRQPLKVLKEVILDPAAPSVGGGVQFGRFHGSDFRTTGVEDYFTYPDGTIDVGMYVRGVKIFNSSLQDNWGVVTPRQSFILPFKDDIDTLLGQGLTPRMEA
jgi:hypothetical protein